MFPRAARLSRNRDIARVWKRGNGAASTFVRIRFLPSPTAVPRLTVVVSLQVSKKAVERNQVKRRLRVILASVYPRLGPVDLVVNANAKARGAMSLALRQDLLPLLARSHLLRSLS